MSTKKLAPNNDFPLDRHTKKVVDKGNDNNNTGDYDSNKENHKNKLLLDSNDRSLKFYMYEQKTSTTPGLNRYKNNSPITGMFSVLTPATTNSGPLKKRLKLRYSLDKTCLSPFTPSDFYDLTSTSFETVTSPKIGDKACARRLPFAEIVPLNKNQKNPPASLKTLVAKSVSVHTKTSTSPSISKGKNYWVSPFTIEPKEDIIIGSTLLPASSSPSSSSNLDNVDTGNANNDACSNNQSNVFSSSSSNDYNSHDYASLYGPTMLHHPQEFHQQQQQADTTVDHSIIHSRNMIVPSNTTTTTTTENETNHNDVTHKVKTCTNANIDDENKVYNRPTKSYISLIRDELEFFITSSEEVALCKSKGVHAYVGQIGMRCKHCSCIPVEERKKGSLVFARKLNTLYEYYNDSKNNRHFEICPFVPDATKKRIEQLAKSMLPQKEEESQWYKGFGYWFRCAENQGVIETHNGLRLKATSTSSTL